MPQTFQVLRCYKCQVFQVHPTKKSNKWKCKLCDEKQSIKRFYGLGTGKECRLHVQKLNGARGQLDGTHGGSDASDISIVSESTEHSGQEETPTHSVPKKSKWLDYIDMQLEEISQPAQEQASPADVVLELPRKRLRKCFDVTNKLADENETECLHKSNSKPAQLVANNTHTSLIKTESKNSIEEISKTNLTMIVPRIVNNSKWAKFVEGTQNSEDDNNMEPITYTNNHNFTFPFLEDEDIDSVLNF